MGVDEHVRDVGAGVGTPRVGPRRIEPVERARIPCQGLFGGGPGPNWRMIVDLATVPEKRSGDLILWVDSYASLIRLFAGVSAYG